MALDENDRAYVRDELRRAEDHLATSIKLVSKDINSHLGDRFAHGWDHHLIERGATEKEEWQRWRDGVNRWRWMMAGAIAVTAVEIPTVATIAVAIVQNMHR